MFRQLFFPILLLSLLSCKSSVPNTNTNLDSNIKSSINTLLNNWHKAAAEANFNDYFSYMSDNSVFIGTDATENWQIKAFKDFSKPYFDKGKAWSFKTLERTIYISENKQLAWFDELLDTQMEICRGSGVLQFEQNKWKIRHYVLSIAIPNDKVKEVVQIKKHDDSLLIKKMKN